MEQKLHLSGGNNCYKMAINSIAAPLKPTFRKVLETCKAVSEEEKKLESGQLQYLLIIVLVENSLQRFSTQDNSCLLQCVIFICYQKAEHVLL